MSTIAREEFAHAINGVSGRMFNCVLWPNGLPANQRWISEKRVYDPGYGDDAKYTLRAEIRFDDNCKNGHATFAIVASGWRDGREDIGGCCHDEIIKAFPELEPLIQWHLVSTDSPMHYVANTVYHAGNRDCWGLVKGQVKSYETRVVFGENPIEHALKPAFIEFLQKRLKRPNTKSPIRTIKVTGTGTDGKSEYNGWTFNGYACKWYECPFKTHAQARNFASAFFSHDPKFIRKPVSWGEGKE
ncbi:unnamed protein product, partial [marine sediment metagenome]